MRFAIQYLREHRGIFLMQLLFTGIFAAAFCLYHLPLAAVLYPAVICFFAGCLYTIFAVCQACKKHRKLTSMQSMHANVLMDAFAGNAQMPEQADFLEQDYIQLILKLCRQMQSAENDMAGSYQDMIDYFTVWVHQIKTPIASMRLHLETEDTRLSRRLTSDLLHIEQYVAMVLTYVKMGSDTTDYVFRAVSLDTVLRENIRRLRGDFIMKKLNLIYEPLQETVISDEKWLSFVIGQILSNALKYTNTGSVAITFEAPGILCIRDTGIGIAPEDLPRIFEKGYTGNNGRGDKQASGLGLYLCRQICSRLGHGISADSKLDAGTTVRIDLSQEQKETQTLTKM